MYEFQSVLNIFRENYKEIPLEIFSKNPYKALISTLMSSRTNDDTTLPAATRLFERAANLKQLRSLTTKEIENLIYPVGFYKTKARHIKQLASKMKKKGDKIPNTREGLMALPGVGRKTANLVLNRAFGKPAIAVDTHVHRISNLLGWVDTKTPQETERELLRIIPRKYWSEINMLFVSMGRQCRSTEKLKLFLDRILDTKNPQA